MGHQSKPIPSLAAQRTDLPEALVTIFERMVAKNPGVAKVECVTDGEPFIVHVQDRHYVEKADLGKAEGPEGDKLDAEYSKMLQTAAAVHKSKLLILAEVPEVFHEGLTDRSTTIFNTELRLLPYHRELKTFDPHASDETKELIEEHHRKLLRLGEAAELKLDGKPIKILPVENAVQRVAKLIPGLPPDRRWQATLREVNGEQRAEIWHPEQRVNRQPELDRRSSGESQYDGNESDAPVVSPATNRFPQRVLVSLIAPAAVAALAAYGLQLLRLSALQIGLEVGLLGLLGLIWLIRFARSLRSHS